MGLSPSLKLGGVESVEGKFLLSRSDTIENHPGKVNLALEVQNSQRLAESLCLQTS